MSLSDAQKELRRLGVGGSESAAVCGLPSFLTPTDVLRSKVDATFTREETDAMWLGNELEPIVLKMWQRRTGLDFQQVGTLKHPALPLVATPDAIADGSGDLLEVKTSAWWRPEFYGAEGSDEVPPAVMAQVQHTMHVMRACGRQVERAHILLFLCGRDLRLYTVPYSEELAQEITGRECAWWGRHVVRREPLPIDDTEAMATYFRKLWPQHEPEKVLTPDEDADKAAHEYLEAARLADAAEARAQRAKNALMSKMKEAERIEGDGYRVTWRTGKNKVRTFRVIAGERQQS